MRTSISFRWTGMFFFLATKVVVFGQASTSVPTAPSASTTAPVIPNPPALTAFLQGQQALNQSMQALMAQNPTAQQMQAWQQQNATAIAAQHQMAQDLAADSYLQPMPTVAAPPIPPSASNTLVSFLTTQVALANAHAQIHNQLLNALPTQVSDTQISQMQQSELQLYQQQQGANLQLQKQQVQALAAQSAQQPVSLPPTLVIPPGASPQMVAFLTAKDQLMRDRINFDNQYTTATSTARAAAQTQWMQENAGRFQQCAT